MKKAAVIVFPGTNCDHDVTHLYRALIGAEVKQVWHKERELGDVEAVIVPGGFSYGDYLRTGALTKLSPVMEAVKAFAAKGGPVLGICNGFQILCESGMLPGVLLQNVGTKFLSRFVHLKVEDAGTPFTKKYKKGDLFTAPIAHGEGNYFADSETLKKIEGEGQVVFRYCAADGTVDAKSRESNPNGSYNAIAGIRNGAGNVVGLMPHPERAAEILVGSVGSDSGLAVFQGL